MNDQTIRDVLTRTQRIALVGASDRPDRPSYGVMKYLLDQGYEVIPVSPKLAGQTLLGQTAYAKLEEVPGKIDMVDVFRNSEAAWGVAQEAIAAGADTLWLQLGVINEQAAVLARQLAAFLQEPRIGQDHADIGHRRFAEQGADIALRQRRFQRLDVVEGDGAAVLGQVVGLADQS